MTDIHDTPDIATRLARPEILALSPYAHASWDPTLERLHANENPWRCSGDNSPAGLNRYPEPHPAAVEARLARLYGVSAGQLIAGRGSDEGIDLLARAFLVPGRDAALVCPPTFGMYAVATRIQGAAVVEVPLDATRGYALDEAAVLAAAGAQVKLLFLCSPGNPTGRTLDGTAIERVLSALAGRALVVVDEAYAEFSAQPSFAPRLARFDNLVVLRTLSKAYSLAGARCGAVLAHPSVIALLRRIIPPYSMPTPCMDVVLAALEPAPLAQAGARIERLKAERARMLEALGGIALVRQVQASDANFLYLQCHDAAAVVARTRAAGLLVRDFSQGRYTPAGVRITIGTPAQNDRLLEALARP